MAFDPQRLNVMCRAVLDAVVARHGGTDGAMLPPRRYVSAGPPAWDCELVAAWCETTAGQEGDPASDVLQGLGSAAGLGMRTATVVVTVARCTPAMPDVVGTQIVVPTVEDEEAASVRLYEDSTRVLNALVAAHAAGELAGCNSLAFAGWNVLGPEGGYVGGELRLRIGMTRL